jgi:ubiquinone/menaquinone biosynthesis C-methylase UbiE
MDFVKKTEARIIFEFLDINSGERICDIACGAGQQGIRMAKRGGKVYGIDIRRRSIEIAKVLAGGYECDFIEGNAEKLPYNSGLFDKVVSVCALEHFDNDEEALGEMNRILKTGGTLVLTVDSFTYGGTNNHVRQIHKNDYHVVNYYSNSQLKEKLENAGFKVVQSRYFVNSPISAFLFTQRLKYQRFKFGLIFIVVLFPLTYSLSTLSDRFWGTRNRGYLLAVKAVKES